MQMVPKGPHLDFEIPAVELAQQIEDLMKDSGSNKDEINSLISKKDKLLRKTHKKLTPWNRVELARRFGRPYTMDYAQHMLTDFIELRGDRCFADDPAIVTGLAKLGGRTVMVIGNQKGTDTKESIRRNFGMSHPEGYRKAARIMKLAEKFKIPIVCFLDTPGAYPGIGAEDRGQATAIAENLKTMAVLEVPLLIVIIGEGASGGALGIGVGDRLLMLENACYYVITPEGCAAILWGDSSKKRDICAEMKLTAPDLKALNVIDRIIPEPPGGAHWNPEEMYSTLKAVLLEELEALERLSIEDLISKRIEKYASMGVVSE